MDKSSDSSSEDDSNETPNENKDCWTPEDDYRLISQIVLQLPKTDDLPFIKRLNSIDWDKIIIQNMSAKDKKWRVLHIMESTRKFRLLREVLADAKSVILDNIKLPKRLYPAFYLFIAENKDKLDLPKSLKKGEYSRQYLEAFLSLSLKEIKSYKLRANGVHAGFQIRGLEANTSDLCSNALYQTPFYLFFKEQRKANTKVSKSFARNSYNALSVHQKLNWMLKSLNITKGERIDLNTYKKAKKIFTKDEMNIFDDYEGRPKCLTAYKLFMKDLYKKRGTGELKRGWKSISEKWKELKSEERALYVEKSEKLKSRYDGEIKRFLQKLPPDRRTFEISANNWKIVLDDFEDDNFENNCNDADVQAVMDELFKNRNERKRNSNIIIVEESRMPSQKKRKIEYIESESSESSDSSDVKSVSKASKDIDKQDVVAPRPIRINQKLKAIKKQPPLSDECEIVDDFTPLLDALHENIGENGFAIENEIALSGPEKIPSPSDSSKGEFLGNTPFSLFFKERKIENPNCKYEKSLNIYKNLKKDEKLYWMLKVVNVEKGEKIDAKQFKKARQLFSKDEMDILNEYEGRPKRNYAYQLYLKQHLETTKGKTRSRTLKDKWKTLSEENKAVVSLKAQEKYENDYKNFLNNLLPDRQKLELEEKGPKMLGILSSDSSATTTAKTDNKVEDCYTSVLDKTYSNFQNIDAHSTVIKQTQLSDNCLDLISPEQHNNTQIILENPESSSLPSFIVNRPPNSVGKFYKEFIHKGSDMPEAHLLYEALNDEEKEIVCRKHIEAKQKYLEKFEGYLKTLSFDEMKKFAKRHSFY